jgi:uncharacterized membrane protein (DUF4010 family)
VLVDRLVLWHLSIALLCGLAVGTEREWSGHARRAGAHIGGIRTFALLGLMAGLSGWMWTLGQQALAAILLLGAASLVVISYFATSRRDVEGTTEVAAFVVMAASLLAGAGFEVVASSVTAVTVLLLVEKKPLHSLVSRLDQDEMRAAAQFAVMAVVILPILPEGPFGPLGGFKPRQLWLFVLLFAGLSFVGYVARRTFGEKRGYAVTGLLGGLLSSTSATVTLSRLSRTQPGAGRALAAGTLGASVVLLARVLVSALIIAPALAQALWPSFLLPAAVGGGLLLRGLADRGRAEKFAEERNPLQLPVALQMAAIFQIVLLATNLARSYYGQAGILGTSFLLGAFEMDGLTLSMAQLTRTGTPIDVAVKAITIGLVANSIVKLGLAVSLGRGAFRPLAGVGLALMTLALAAGIYWR